MLDFGIDSWTANRYLITHTQTLTIKDVIQALSLTFITAATK